MVLEQEIPTFVTWFGPALASYMLVAFLVSVFAALLAWVSMSAVSGPLAAGDRCTESGHWSPRTTKCR